MKFVGLDGLKHFWSNAKTWITGQITAEVTAKIAEIVANAPKDLDTLKEIADWISAHANDAAAMNTQINTNKSDISALQTSVAGKADKSHTHTKSEITDFAHNHDDRYYTESEVDTKLSGKADKSHTHTKSEITDFPTSLKNPNALTINGKTYDGSTAVDAGVQTVENGGTGVTTQAEINRAFIGNLEEGNSDVTDSTEFVSSYASNNGFSDTNAVNKPYKRKFSKVWNYIKGKADSIYAASSHTHTKSQITDFPTSLPANGGIATKASLLDEYVGAGGTRLTSGNIVPKDASEYGGMRKDVVTDCVTDGSHPGQDGHLLTMFWDNSGRYDSQLFVSNVKQPTTVKVRVKANEADYGPWVDLITSQNIGSQTVAMASTAETADYARNMYYQNIDLSELDKTKFYPLVCVSYQNFTEVAICSESMHDIMDYNQNRIHFDISTQGWSDTTPTLNIREYACYQNNEVTIGCIGRGLHGGAWAIWLRGGLHYTCFSRDSNLSLHTSDYTFGDEVYTVGTNYYGGANSNVEIMFTPQSTITEGAYSSRPITAPNIKANNMMVIPIGVPSSLEDGCIWIER